MADLIAKLKLDSNQFDTNINKSKQQVKKFETNSKGSMKNFDSTIKNVGGSLLQFAGLIGIGAGAIETLNKTIESNQTTSDLFANTINSSRESVDMFFKSVALGDFTSFNDGIVSTFNNLFKLNEMLDELADKKISMKYIKSADMTDYERFAEQAKDVTNSKEVRVNAAQNLEGLGNSLAKKITETNNLQYKTLIKEINTKSGFQFDKSDLEYFVTNTNFSGNMTADATEAYKTYVKLTQQVKGLKEAQIFDLTGAGDSANKYNQKKKELKLYEEENKFLIKQGVLAVDGDVARAKMVESLIEMRDTEKEIYQLQQKTNKIIKTVKKGDDKEVKGISPKKTKEIVYESGSLGNLNKELSSLNNKLLQATEESTRFGIRQAIEKLNKEKLNIELEATLSVDQLSNDKPFNKPIGKKPTDALTDKIPTFNSEPAKLINTDNSTLEYLTAISNLMGAMQGVTDNAAASWISYAANIIAGAASMLPALASLFGITAALGMAEQATLPFPLSVIALAATGAALVASIAMIPKFATGGIVSGNSFAGDNVIARVNSGEMILNGKQQSNLFDLLDNGSSNNGGGGNSQLTFKINGKDLYATLNNYNNSIKKY